MGKKFAHLDCIEHNRSITAETDRDFLHRLQSALLMALRDQGALEEMQYRWAQDRLDKDYRKERTL